MRRDRVSPELALEVFARDGGCVAPRLGGSAADCWGRLTIAHVKREPRMAKRAEPELGRLASVCQGHMEDGTRAGRCWVTQKANIAALRAYLESVTA